MHIYIYIHIKVENISIFQPIHLSIYIYKHMYVSIYPSIYLSIYPLYIFYISIHTYLHVAVLHLLLCTGVLHPSLRRAREGHVDSLREGGIWKV